MHTFTIFLIVSSTFSCILAELLECKIAEDTDICVFEEEIDHNMVIDFRPSQNISILNVTKIAFLRHISIEKDEIVYRLCDIFFNLQDIYANNSTFKCSVHNAYNDNLAEKHYEENKPLVIEDVIDVHGQILEDVISKGTAEAGVAIHYKLNMIIIGICILVLLLIFVVFAFLIRYIRKKRQDMIWRRSLRYSRRYGQNQL